MGEWVEITLGNACTKIGSGATPRGGNSVYLEEGPYALIRSQNVHNDGFRREGLAFIGEAHAAELANVEVLEGDVLLNITGDSVARACLVDPGVLPARVNQHVAIIRPDAAKLDSRFLLYCLISPRMQETLLAWAASGATRNALTKAMIESITVIAPRDVRQQRAIADVLGTLDDKIELNRRMSETLEEMARALFESWFVRFDPVRAKMEGRDSGLPADLADYFPNRLIGSELGDIPEGWPAIPLKDVLTERNDRVGEANVPEYSSTNSGLQPRATRFKKLLSASKSKYKLIRQGDLVFGLSRQVLNFGLMRDEVGCVSPAYRVFSIDRDAIVPDLLERMMRMRSGYYYGAISGSSREGQAISPRALGQLRAVIPPRAVQDGYCRLVEPLLARARLSYSESDTLSTLRDALLPKLISGELRVKDAERLVAAAT